VGRKFPLRRVGPAMSGLNLPVDAEAEAKKAVKPTK
jgi:hypothetical protein